MSSNNEKYRNQVIAPALRIALVFFVGSCVWIFFSDQILIWLDVDRGEMHIWQLLKGWFFVLTFGVVLFFLIKRNLRQKYELSNRFEHGQLIYRTITEKMLTAIAIIEESGAIQYVNPAFCRIFNYQQNQVLNNHFNIIVPPAEQDKRLQVHHRFFHDNGDINGFFSVLNRQGELLIVYVDGVPIPDEKGNKQLLLFMNDVTVQQRTELKLAASEQRYRVMMESLNDPVMIINSSQHIVYANHAFKEQFGEPPPETPCYQFVFGNDFPCPFAGNYKSLSGSEGVAQVEDPRTGSIYRVNRVSLPDYGDGQLDMTIIQDLTEIIEAQRKAGESDRLKSSFLANMSHEIRTPLNSILGFSNLLLDEQITGEERGSFVALIDQSGKQLLKVIDDVIDYSFIQSGILRLQSEKVVIKDLVNELLQYSQKQKELYQKTEVEVVPDIELSAGYLYYGDYDRIKQICVNLLDNALKFTDKGFVCFNVYQNNEHLVFSVIDSGVGISEDKREIVFERFRQVDEALSRSFGGSGLGLSISKELTELMGGTISMTSQLGRGSRVDVKIPLDGFRESR